MPDSAPLDAVILCGGEGRRLRARIGPAQKTMAELNGRPFLATLLAYLERQGLRRFILATGYQARDVEAYFTADFSRRNEEIVFSTEHEPLGTGGAVRQASRDVRSDPFFVMNGDSFCPVDLTELWQRHQRKQAIATLVVTPVSDARDYGTVEIDANGGIKAFVEKAAQPASADRSAWVSAGIYCFSASMLDHIPAGRASSLEADVFPAVLKSFPCRLMAMPVEQPFIDIGTPERFEAAASHLQAFKQKGVL